MTAIQCVDVSKSFQQGDVKVVGLDHLSLIVDEGEFVCLSGPSGSGKTSLLNAMGGLDSLDSGEIYIGERRVDQLNKGAKSDLRLRHIGFVFQAYNLIPVLTAMENVEFVMQLQGVDRQTREQKAMSILKEVGLEGMEHRRPSQLSGGQQQRVAVARAIVSEPDLVLADEPTANLDSTTAVQLVDLFLHLNEKHNITFIIATHDDRVMSRCKRLVRMVDGKVVSDTVQ